MNNSEQKQALESIRLMLGARLNSQSSIGPETVKGYLVAVSECSLEGVQRACHGFLTGNVIDFNNDFAPSAARLAEEARKWDNAVAMTTRATSERQQERLVPYPQGALPPPPAEPLGPLTVDFGEGVIDLRGKTFAEKEAIMATKGHPTERITNDVPKPRLKRI